MSFELEPIRNSEAGTRTMREPRARSTDNPPLSAVSLGWLDKGHGTSAAPETPLGYVSGGAAKDSAQLSATASATRSLNACRTRRLTAR